MMQVHIMRKREFDTSLPHIDHGTRSMEQVPAAGQVIVIKETAYLVDQVYWFANPRSEFDAEVWLLHKPYQTAD